MVDFSDREKLEVRLIYYPPYHSKYNGIERSWGGLERSGNGSLRESIEGVLMRARLFFWRAVQTTGTLLKGVYEKGVQQGGKEKRELAKRLCRSEKLPSWDITILPVWVD